MGRDSHNRRVLMGVIGRPHGVRGLVRVQSYTAEPADLASFYPLADERGRQFALRWVGGDGIAEVFSVEGGLRRKIADRDAAAKLTNVRLYVDRSQLPKADKDEFYLADLVGMEAVEPSGRSLGHVAAVHDYGAGASLEIGARVVPFTKAAVPVVDVAAGRMMVVLPEEVTPEPPPLAGGSWGRGAKGEIAPASPLHPNPPPRRGREL